MRAARNASVNLIVGLACLSVLVLYARSVSAGRLTHGFVAYHTAAQLLLEGRMGPQVYDFGWFQGEVQRRTATRVLEIFGPNPPTMALLALPVAVLEPRTARTLWLLISWLALAASTFFLAKEVAARQTPFLPIAIAMLLISPAVFANLRTGQAYLVVGACFAGAAIALSHRRDTVAGICLGLAVILKTAGVPWLVVLAMIQRWRALGVALGTIVLVGIGTLPWTGLETWRVYPGAVTAFVARPSTGVTAYQTTVGFVRHWCGPDASLGGGAGCPTIDALVPWLILGIAVAITAVTVRHAPTPLANAAGVCLSLLCIPLAEDHQFVLLAVPIVALVTTPVRWTWVVVAILVLVPAQLTVERFTTGWLSWLAYPRLYATWLLWALTIHGMRAATRKPLIH